MRPAFVEVDAPSDDELHALLQSVITRLMKMLTRRGVLVEDMGQTYLAEPDADGEEARTLRPLQAAAITYRIAFGARAGQKVLTRRGAMPREGEARQPLCADIDGFSLHAAVRVEAQDRKRLEQLRRYITRPAVSDERVQLNATGQVELKLKTPWRAEPAGVHAAAGGVGAAAQAAPDQVPRRAGAEREAAPAGGAASAARTSASGGL